jgi:carbon monoxide dehydrogenase subunit G
MNVKSEIEINSDRNLVWRILSNVNEYSRWNPHINHAVLYGQFEKNNDIKLVSGKWEYEFKIIEIVFEHGLYLVGKTIGVNIDLKMKLDDSDSKCKLIVDLTVNGLITAIFKKKIEQATSDFIGLFLSSLKVRAELGEAALDKETVDRDNKSRADSFHMPTPFNIVYKSGTRTKRKKLK